MKFQRNEAHYSDITKLIAEREYDTARSKLREIGLTVDRDERAPENPRVVEHKIEQVTFICGLHRSGTTLFHDYLAKNFDVAFIQKAKVPENEGQFLQDVYPTERPFGGPGMFAFYPQMTPALIDDESVAAQLANRMLSNWAAYLNDPTHAHLLEKSPPNLVRIAYLRSIFPQARFIIWTRDPRAVAMSTQKWHAIPIDTLMQHWNTAYMQAIESLKDDCMIVRYEDFCQDPEGVAGSVADFCGMTRRATVLDPGQRFEAIKNSNQKYFDGFPKRFRTRAKLRAWELFGYSFKASGPRVR